MKPPVFNIFLIAIVYFLFTFGCGENSLPGPDIQDVNFKEEMRTFVKEIGAFARNQDPDFILIPQNGHRLVSSNAEDNGEPVTDYLAAVDGLGQEDFFYGYDDDDKATPNGEREYMQFFLDLGKAAGKTILVTDYCSTNSKMEDSYDKNEALGYLSFAADHRELDNIPDFPSSPNNENDEDILTLSDARNFLYLINPDQFSSKAAFLEALAATNYDVIIMDAFFDEVIFTSTELDQIREKANGGSRLLISYMSIGEAEDYRYYWQSDWKPGTPDWIVAENPDWRGNYKVAYWEEGWKNYIFGNADSYTQKLINAGFDGAYLDIIEGFEYFE